MEKPNFSSGFLDKTGQGINENSKLPNVKEDWAFTFKCSLDQIAATASEVNEQTVAYIGEWNPTIAIQIQPHLSRITHLYESYPGQPIFYKNLEIDQTLTSEIATHKISQQPFHLSSYGGNLISKTEFSHTKENYEIAAFSVAQLGFPQGATIEQIYAKAESLGLKLCPAEIGPQLRLQYTNQPKGFQYYLMIAMKKINDGEGDLRMFGLDHNLEGLRLNAAIERPGYLKSPASLFVFCLASSRR